MSIFMKSSSNGQKKLRNDEVLVDGIIYQINKDLGHAMVEQADHDSDMEDFVVRELIVKDGVEFPVMEINMGAFAGNKNIRSIKIPSSVTCIDHYSFMDSSLEEISLPESIDIIGSEAFKNCQNLKSIFLPMNVGYIHEDTFTGCTNLESITVNKRLQKYISAIRFPERTKIKYYTCETKIVNL